LLEIYCSLQQWKNFANRSRIDKVIAMVRVAPFFWLTVYTVSQKSSHLLIVCNFVSNLNRFSYFLHCWKEYDICYKTHMTLPPHLRHIATLPWEIKKFKFFCSCGRKRILIASNFVTHPQILLFSVFKIANLSPYWLQISMSVFFYLLTFAINLWHRKFVTADVTAVCLSTVWSCRNNKPVLTWGSSHSANVWWRSGTSYLRKS